MIIANLVDSLTVLGGDSQNGGEEMRFRFGQPGNSLTIESLPRDYWKVGMILNFESKLRKYGPVKTFEQETIPDE